MIKDLVTYRLEMKDSAIIIDEGIRGTGNINANSVAKRSLR